MPDYHRLGIHMKRVLWFLVLVCAGGAAALAQQERRDVVAAIALEPPPSERRGVLEAKPPRPVPAIEVESRRNDPGVRFPRRAVMRTREEFRAALAALREEYAPYLADHTPPADSTRARVEFDQFDFRMEEAADRSDIARVFRGEGTWNKVRIPDYRGPVGWWTGYYRKVFRVPESVARQPSAVLRFGAVDYRCQVYVNGRMMGAHTGYFAPFEIDVTSALRADGDNVLVVRVENDSIMMGLESWKGPDVDGDKIYAAVGPGWDDPEIGWHECAPGAGIWQKVFLEGRPKLHITDVFARPDLDRSEIEIRVEVYQPETRNRDVEFEVSIYPKNFQGRSIEHIKIGGFAAGPGVSEKIARIRMTDPRVWRPNSPYLYTARVVARPKDGGPSDNAQTQFGMRKFTIDETSSVKGTLHLNNEPVILRGANTMGHLMVVAMKGDREQLIEDVLIAKLANMNYFRLTQSPVQPEVYDVFDQLGMMAQTDLPLFGYLRRPVLEEAVKQAGEMERLVRSHASNIMISYINEPFAPRGKEHRHLTREEMERFFEASSAIVKVYNPDRVIKPVDGDYDPPGPGLPDNHIYSAWYGSHAVPIGKFMRGYWVDAKPGWKMGSGEYGIEGLEDSATMLRHYPKEWLPASPGAPWHPGKIPFSQTYTMHHSWFDAEETMRAWIEASQRHQAWGVREMTRAFRRQSDRIVSTAVHLLIDAWPAGWMKTLVDVDRRPKPAYFEFKEALTPLMAGIRTDRLRYYAGEDLRLEFWVANDRRAEFERGRLVWEVLRGGARVFAQSDIARIPSYGAAFQGHFRWQTPALDKRERMTVRLGLLAPDGRLIHDTETEVEVFPAPVTARYASREVAIVGRAGGRAWKLAESLGAKPRLLAGAAATTVFVDSFDAFDVARDAVLQAARNGASVVFLEQSRNGEWNLGETAVKVRTMGGKEFVSRKTGHALVAGFAPFDFAYWYDPEKDYVEYVARSYVEGVGLAPVLITGENARPGDPYPMHRSMSVVGEMKMGRGRLIFSELKTSGRIATEPVARAFFERILDGAAR